MPNPEVSRWRAMAQQLQQASEQHNWERVAKLDQMLAQWLQTPPSLAEECTPEMWRALQQAHGNALQACRLAKQEAAQQLHHLQTQQEAQQAYAWQETLG